MSNAAEQNNPPHNNDQPAMTIADLAAMIQGLETTMEKNFKAVDENFKAVNRKLDRLLDATPGAAQVPNVFVCGDKQRALVKGAWSTWTLVKALKRDVDPTANTSTPPTTASLMISTPGRRVFSARNVTPEQGSSTKAGASVEDPYYYFLVSTGHSISEIRDVQRAGRDKESAIFLCDDIFKTLQDNKWEVKRVGFHKDIFGECDYDKDKHIDIVFIQLAEKPTAASYNFVPEVEPTGDIRQVVGQVKPIVAGTALSGCVNGNGLAMDGTVFSFVSHFVEHGCSGTVMFGYKRAEDMIPPCGDAGTNENVTETGSSATELDEEGFALGVLKGTRGEVVPEKRARGVIVPFPAWNNVHWSTCLGQTNLDVKLLMATDCVMERPIGRGYKVRKGMLFLERFNKEFEFRGRAGHTSQDFDDDFELVWMDKF